MAETQIRTWSNLVSDTATTKAHAEIFFTTQQVAQVPLLQPGGVPLVNQMNPSADVKALSSIRVDIAVLSREPS